MKNLKLAVLKRMVREAGERLHLNITVDPLNPMRAFRVSMLFSLYNEFLDGLDEINERVVKRIRERLQKAIDSKEFSESTKEELKENLEAIHKVDKLIQRVQECMIIKADDPEDLKEGIKHSKEIDETLSNAVKNLEKKEFVFTKTEILGLKRVIEEHKLTELLGQIFKLWRKLVPSSEFV